MAVISGKNAIVDGTQGVGFWKLQWNATDASIVHSTSEGVVIRVEGNVDWRGVYQSYGHTPVTMPGAALSFKGEGLNGKGASGTAIVDRVDIIWDIANARPIYHNCHFSANGALAFGTPSGSNISYAAPAPSVGLANTVKWGGTGGTVIPNVFHMMLSLISKNAPYVDSSTLGQVKREAGNFDLAWVYRRNFADPSAADGLPDVNDIDQLLFYVDTTFWDIHDAIVRRVVPVYDTEGGREHQGKILSATVAGKLNMIDNTDYVADPSTTKWIDFSD